MNKLKSVFVSLYMLTAISILLIAGRALWNTGNYAAWGGVLLVTVPFMAILGRITVFQDVARTSARLPALVVLATIGVALAAWGHSRGGSIAAPVLAAVAWVGFIGYDYWYSSLGHRASEHLMPGQILPAFELKNVRGEWLSSASLLDTPTIWIFYRGNWCPLCMAQIKEMAAEYQQLQALGVRVALVSPQPHKYTVRLANKFDVAFDFLSDAGNHAARKLGIAHEDGLPMGLQALGYDSETVMPTVIITDTGGPILWSQQTDNYRVRPEPATYLRVLQETGAVDRCKVCDGEDN